jgi:hypothetical protein
MTGGPLPGLIWLILDKYITGILYLVYHYPVAALCVAVPAQYLVEPPAIRGKGKNHTRSSIPSPCSGPFSRSAKPGAWHLDFAENIA